MACTDVIKLGEHIILKRGKTLRLYQVWRKSKVNLDKKHFCLDKVIGKPYGTTWDVHGHNVQLVSPDSDEEANAQEGGADNRSIVDNKRSQKLSDVDIQELKKIGKHGEAIVEQLVENSTSFKKKTVYSQAKYLKRKRDKHLMRFQILRPNTLLLCEMYGNRAPSKNIYLRMDTLAQILTSTNIQTGINVMVMETCQGLLLGSIMERMGGQGIIVQIHSEHLPVRLAVDAYNFPASFTDILYSYPLDQLNQLESSECHSEDTADAESSGCASAQNKEPEPSEPIDLTLNSKDANLETSGSTDSSGQTNLGDASTEKPVSSASGEARTDSETAVGDGAGKEEGDVAMETDCKPGDETSAQGQKRKSEEFSDKEARRQKRKESLLHVQNLLQTTQMDALVMACKFQPLLIFKALFKFLAPSRPFAVYCHYIEPLMECNDWLRNSDNAVNIRVSETWLREYQVLPERTHPAVNMSGTGGYILTGTKVTN